MSGNEEARLTRRQRNNSKMYTQFYGDSLRSLIPVFIKACAHKDALTMPLNVAKRAFHRVIAAVSDCLVDLERVLSMERQAPRPSCINALIATAI